jgi:DNA-binding MarR family transcriptional regulator
VTGKPEQEAFVQLQRAASRLNDDVARLLKPAGLRPTQYNVLRILRGARPDPLSCGDITARMITREPDLTRLLDRLETAGLVSRCRGNEDRRVVRVAISPQGLALLKSLDAPMLALHRRQFSTLGDKKTALLTNLAAGLAES